MGDATDKDAIIRQLTEAIIEAELLGPAEHLVDDEPIRSVVTFVLENEPHMPLRQVGWLWYDEFFPGVEPPEGAELELFPVFVKEVGEQRQ